MSKRGKDRWRPDYPYKKKAPVSVVGAALRAIEARYGELTPTNTVKAARAKAHPLHPFFEWDGRKAAHEYRLEQARRLIRAVICIPKEAVDDRPLRAWVHVVDKQEADTRRKYVGMDEGMRTPRFRAQILEQAKREARAFREKYASLKELAKVFAAIDRL